MQLSTAQDSLWRGLSRIAYIILWHEYYCQHLNTLNLQSPIVSSCSPTHLYGVSYIKLTLWISTMTRWQNCDLEIEEQHFLLHVSVTQNTSRKFLYSLLILIHFFKKKAKSCLTTMLDFQIFYKQMPIQLAAKIFKVFLRTKRME